LALRRGAFPPVDILGYLIRRLTGRGLSFSNTSGRSSPCQTSSGLIIGLSGSVSPPLATPLLDRSW